MLFSPFTLRGIQLRNRIMVSPMCQYSCDDGFASDWHLVHLSSRAVGGAGLVMAEAAAVQASGRISLHDLGIWKDEHIEALARVSRFVSLQGAAAGIQIAHAGRRGPHRHGGVHHLRPAGRSHYPQRAGRPRHRGPAGASRPLLAAACGRRAACGHRMATAVSPGKRLNAAFAGRRPTRGSRLPQPSGQ